MPSLSELLSNDSVDKLNMVPGTVLLGKMEGVVQSGMLTANELKTYNLTIE